MRNLDDSFSNIPIFKVIRLGPNGLFGILQLEYIFSPNAVAVFLSRREVLRVVMTIVIGNKHDQAAAIGALPPSFLSQTSTCFFYFPSNTYLTLNEYHERYHSQGWIAGLLL